MVAMPHGIPMRQAERSEFGSGPWPKLLLLLIVLGIVAGFIAGFWVGILGLCFGAVLIATLPLN